MNEDTGQTATLAEIAKALEGAKEHHEPGAFATKRPRIMFRVPVRPNPAIDRCAAQFPQSVAVILGGEVVIRDPGNGLERGRGSSLARACKDALKRARS